MSTVNKSVTVADIIVLNREFSTFAAEQVPGVVKFRAAAIRKRLIKILEDVNEIQIEIIKKHGGTEIRPGVVQLENEIVDPSNPDKKIVNPAFSEYSKEWELILDEKKDIKYTPIDLKSIENIVLKADYLLLFDFVQE